MTWPLPRFARRRGNAKSERRMAEKEGSMKEGCPGREGIWPSEAKRERGTDANGGGEVEENDSRSGEGDKMAGEMRRRKTMGGEAAARQFDCTRTEARHECARLPQSARPAERSTGPLAAWRPAPDPQSPCAADAAEVPAAGSDAGGRGCQGIVQQVPQA